MANATDKSLESWIWDAACSIRGAKDAPKFKDYNQMGLPLFAAQTLFPPIRQETIHQVKGESIDGVLVLGSAKFFNTVVDSISSGVSSEERRLAYVAMTRARHVLVVGLPAAQFDKHSDKWIGWGFNVL